MRRPVGLPVPRGACEWNRWRPESLLTVFVPNPAGGFGGGGKDILEYSDAGKYIGNLPAISSAIAGSVAACVVHNGMLYVNMSDGAAVEQYDFSKGQWNTFVQPKANELTSNSAAIAFDSSGNLYVGDDSTGNILEYDPSGTFVKIFVHGGQVGGQPDGPVFPGGMTFDSQGNLYVSTVISGDGSGPGQSCDTMPMATRIRRAAIPERRFSQLPFRNRIIWRSATTAICTWRAPTRWAT